MKNDKNYEIERGKLIIQQREKTIQKLKEAHKKEVQDLQRVNTSAQDDLNYLKKENTNIKDKEKNLLDIFAILKKFVQVDVGKTTNNSK